MIEEIIDKYGVNTLVLYPARTVDRKILDHVRERYPNQEESGPAGLVRVRPLGGDCASAEPFK